MRWMPSFNCFPRSPRYVSAGPAECIDVIFPKSWLFGKGIRISRAVLLNDFELQLRPTAKLIELKGECCHAPARKSCLGNWLQIFPSSFLPPVLGERPPIA